MEAKIEPSKVLRHLFNKSPVIAQIFAHFLNYFLDPIPKSSVRKVEWTIENTHTDNFVHHI